MNKGYFHKICYVFLGLLIVMLGLFAWVSYEKYVEIKDNPQKYAEATVKDVLDQVNKLMVLPQDETPTIATVSDPNKLRGQAFFSQAKIGDKVLIYTQARKAILYDPKLNKIVEVAPLFIGVGQNNGSVDINNL